MEIYFDSLSNFENALIEVEILINVAGENEKDKPKYYTYNKAALLLLVAKFENFVEQVVEEYAEIINNMKLNANFIPEFLKVNHSLYVMDKLKDTFEHQHKYEEIKGFFVNLGELWNGSNVVNSLEINSKFNYGKHGEKELIKLFNKVK